MDSITHSLLATWITENLAEVERLRRDFPGSARKICPSCGSKHPVDRVTCFRDNTILAPTVAKLGQPDLLLQALRGTEFTERFALSGYIDEGQLCWVFEGLNTRRVTPVAVKVLRHELASDQKTKSRFLTEARLWQELKHSNIMAVEEIGVIPELLAPPQNDQTLSWGTDILSDRPYIVMEYIKGTNMKTVLQEYGVLSPNITIKIAMNVLKALQCAHRQEIVHRDLKPSNIFLVPLADGNIEVKVSDFGLAARMFRQIEWAPQTTKTGSVYGDPSYLSPEYLIEQKTSPRSDIYSLGCIMYECLSGKTPFAGQHEFHTMIRHVKDTPDKFSKNLRIPESLETTIYRAIEKEPANRFESAEHMYSHLEKLTDSVTAA